MQLNPKRLFTSFYIIVIVLIATGNFEIRSARAAGLWYVKNGGSDGNDCQSPATACASINAALNKPGVVAGDTIRVAVGTYTGTGSEVVWINKDVTLSGGWDATFTTQSGMATIDGEGVRRGVTVYPDLTVVIDRFTVQNGFDRLRGGGFYNRDSTLLISNSLIINNTTSEAGYSYGGGVYNQGVASILNISNSIIEGNAADGRGAGISIDDGLVTVNNTNINKNRTGMVGGATGKGGGGISNSGTLVLNNTSVTGNTLVGEANGSGIFELYGSLTLNNSTVSGNTNGDGIFAWGGSATLNNATVSNNGRIGIYNYNGIINLKNTVIANNSTGDCFNDPSGGPVTSLGYTLVRNNSNCSLGASDMTNVDPKLGPLQNNGGSTLTQSLLSGSPAVNAGNPSGCTDHQGNILTTDQRGFPRSGRCDIGAFELQTFDHSRKTVNPTNSLPGRPVTFTIKVNNTSNASVPNILVTDTLPASLAYIPDSLSATSGTPTYQSGTIFWNGTLGAGQSANITFGATVNPATPLNTSIVNSATLNGGGSTMTLSAVVDVIERTFLPNTMLDYVPPPPPPSCSPGICGRVKLNGVAIGGEVLNLRFYNGSSWSTMASTTTASDGLYSFTGIPSLSAGQRYYVRYSNSSINTRLSSWSTRILSAYIAGSIVPIGDFDIANINLSSPAPGAIVSLPSTFNWNVRPATATDSYELNLLDYTDGNPWWWSPSLGFTGSYAMNSLPVGFSPGVPYGWFVGVYSQDGGYGESYYLYVVAFNNTGNAPRPSAPARARPTLEDLPRPKVLNKR